VSESAETLALVDAEDRWLAALTDGDAAALEALLAPEFSVITYLGSEPVSRERYLRNASMAFEFEEPLRFELLSARVVGNIAIVQGRVHQRGSVQGHRLPEVILGTDVWMWTGDRWQVLARHASTPAPPR
jgi:ketosteroid isomerase-like protein